MRPASFRPVPSMPTRRGGQTEYDFVCPAVRTALADHPTTGTRQPHSSAEAGFPAGASIARDARQPNEGDTGETGFLR